MAAIWFRAPLTCLHCGSHSDDRATRLHTPGFGRYSTDSSVFPGEVLDLHLDEFSDGYLTLRHPGAESDFSALEQWSCPVCGRAQWARLDFHREDPEHYRFTSARTVALTPGTLGDMNFISRWMDLWVESNPGDETEQILPLIQHLLP